MAYRVKEIHYTLQGEGAQTGRAAVFLRFAGCNLWSGREKDRAGADCRFCDTDFVGVDGPGGGVFDGARDLVRAVRGLWPGGGAPFVVCTGGEPLLQLDEGLIDALRTAGFEVAVETNGTREAPETLDWICVSPKAGTTLKQVSGQELKLVYPQEGLDPLDFEDMDFRYFFLQPMDGPNREPATRAAIEFCRDHPRWRISLQTHKLMGID